MSLRIVVTGPVGTDAVRYPPEVDVVEAARLTDPAERAAIAALFTATARAEGHVALDLVDPSCTPTSAAFVLRDTTDDTVTGYAQVKTASSGFVVEYCRHPMLAGAGADVAALLQRVFEEIASRGGGRVDLWIQRPSTADEELAARLHLVSDRAVCQMRRALRPDELIVAPDAQGRTFRVGSDEAAFLATNNAAFADHHEQGAWDLAVMRDHERQAWFDPTGFFLEINDGRVAAFCWTKIHGEIEEVGEIYAIAVHPDFQGRGLGRVLLLRGLAYLAQRCLRQAMLYVAADNDAAIALYQSLGFTTDHLDRAYRTEIAPAQ